MESQENESQCRRRPPKGESGEKATSTMSTEINLAEGMQAVLAEEARLATLTQADAEQFWMEGAADMQAIEDYFYPGAGNQQQRLRLYRATPDVRPVLIYIHGGGWIGGSIELNESAARALAAQSGRHVVSISYRFAPEHPYPAALSDCIAAVDWLKSDRTPVELSQYLNLQHIAIGGASAGANLALSTALSLPLNAFDALILFYGVFDDDMTVQSYTQYPQGPGMTRARMEMLLENYDPDYHRRTDPTVLPLHADFKGLPDTVVAAAEIDVLRSENEVLAERLQASGVSVTHWIEPGVTHGYINRGRLLPGARDTLTRAATALAGIPVRA